MADAAACPAAAVEAAMTLDEFKQGIFRSLRDSGAMELVRAQLRRRIIEKLQQQRADERVEVDEASGEMGGGDDEAERGSGRKNEDRVACGLIAEFLRERGMENTLAVFVPESGGARNQLDGDAIVEMLRVTPAQKQRLDEERKSGGRSLLSVVLAELEARLSVRTIDCESQTTIDCFDHRITLDHQLRHVERNYLAECESQKLEPAQSLEQRMLQYQAEYDSLSEKRLQEELERYKATELALARTEERKRYDREVEILRTSLFQEHREKVRRLAEREREMELAFTAKQTDLETSLFDTRQSLMQQMEKLRTQEAEQQARREVAFRKFTTESKRLETWEENLRAQETNLEGLIAHRIREKERAWTLERQRVEQDYQFKLEELRVRESALSQESDALKTASLRAAELHIQCSSALQEQKKCEDEILRLQTLVAASDKEVKHREAELQTKQAALKELKAEIECLTAVNARLSSDKAHLGRDAARLEQINAKLDEDVAKLDAEVKSLQQQVVAMKLSEASELVAERRKLLKTLDDERERFYWKENELLTKVRDLQTRLVESEAVAEKFQSQYEDERVHVESLRHDVASLNSLLTQAHVTINAKHGAVSSRDAASSRSARPNLSEATGQTGAPQAFDGMMRMKMMEFMAAMQGGVVPGSRQAGPVASSIHPVPVHADLHSPPDSSAQAQQQESDEEKQLKAELQRRERELLEQREYEKRQRERQEAEERDMAARKQQFEDEMARMRLARCEEDERAEALRKERLAEEEARIQRQLELQQKAIQGAIEEQERFEKLRAAEAEARAQREKTDLDRQHDERVRQAEELEAKLQQQRLEAEEADRQRSEKTARELEEIQKRREQLDTIEHERRRLEREKADAEAKRLQDAADQAKRQQQQIEKQEAEEAAAKAAANTQQEQQAAEVSPAVLPSLEAPDEQDQVVSIGSAQECAPASSVSSGYGEGDAAPTAPTVHDSGAPATSSDDAAPVAVKSPVASAQDDSSQLGSSSDDDPSGDTTAMSASVEQEEAAGATPTFESVDEEAPPTISTEVESKSDGTAERDAAPVKSEAELEEARRQHEEEQKKKQDEEVIDVFRQRVLARKAAEKQRQQEQEAEKKLKEDEEKKAAALRDAQQSVHGSADGSENELELSGGSFAESSAASSADSF